MSVTERQGTGPRSSLQTAGYAVLAVLAFAGNSLLCRAALGERAIDPGSFALIRLASGALVLLLLTNVAGRPAGVRAPRGGSWLSAALLAAYAVPFSLAYLSLSAGTGALVLFGAVQLTMVLAGLWAGERLRPWQWVGCAVAFAGVVYLVSPGLAAPSMAGSALMGAAGIAWGAYSLRGRGVADPIAETTGNFARAVPFAAAVSVSALDQVRLSSAGIVLAVVSGALASGGGYVVWYTALRGLTATRAAVIQLSVPVIAAAGGVLLLGETLSARLGISACLVLGGIGLALGRPGWPSPRR